MKKLLCLLLVFLMAFGMMACGNDTDGGNSDTPVEDTRTYQEKLIEYGFQETIQNTLYQFDLENGNRVVVIIVDEQIDFQNKIADTQISYDYINNTAYMYGCIYNYGDDTYTEDVDSVGACTESTVDTLKNDKLEIDAVMTAAGLDYSELVNN